MDSAICTIIAKNYIAFARTLAQSFLSYNPGYKVYVLIVDNFDGYIKREEECFEVIRLSDLAIRNLPSLCFKYDLKELCTAVKPQLLEYLFEEKGVKKLIYLDPDILVTSSLDQLYDKLEKFDIIITPHLDKDYPNDGLLPDDGYILRAGQFNLGFIGVNSGHNAREFLSWWKQKLDENCVVDLMNGYFVDQKFIDFVPILFQNFFIERDTGYNVAYWNLHSRKLSKTNASWQCNRGHLYFFHFSGYTPGRSAISTHIPLSMARHDFSNRPDLKELFETYQRLLLENGYERSCEWPYSFANFKSGRPIPASVRSYYRQLNAPRNSIGDPFESRELESISMNGNEHDHSSAKAQLDAILNSRAWRWVSRYGRLKNRLARMFARQGINH